MLEWLGLRGEHSPDEIPMWQGTAKRTKWISAAVWLTVAILSFLFIKNILHSSDGFLFYLPIYTAIIVFAAGMSVTERSCIRVQKTSRG